MNELLPLDTTEYGGDTQVFRVRSETSNHHVIVECMVLAEGPGEALDEMLEITDGEMGFEFIVRPLRPTEIIEVLYHGAQDAVEGIFHAGTKEAHPAFVVEDNEEEYILVKARAATWAHLFENANDIPGVLYVIDNR